HDDEAMRGHFCQELAVAEVAVDAGAIAPQNHRITRVEFRRPIDRVGGQAIVAMDQHGLRSGYRWFGSYESGTGHHDGEHQAADLTCFTPLVVHAVPLKSLLLCLKRLPPGPGWRSTIRLAARKRGTRPAAVLLEWNRAFHDHFHGHDTAGLYGKELRQQGASTLPMAGHFKAIVEAHARNGEHDAAFRIHHGKAPVVDGAAGEHTLVELLRGRRIQDAGGATHGAGGGTVGGSDTILDADQPRDHGRWPVVGTAIGFQGT